MDVDLTINKNPAFLQPASEWQSYATSRIV
jgi:hypothetical protein